MFLLVLHIPKIANEQRKTMSADHTYFNAYTFFSLSSSKAFCYLKHFGTLLSIFQSQI